MRLQISWTNDTTALLQIAADESELNTYKQKVLHKLQSDLKLTGFRKGKAPLDMVEKSVDQTALQNEFLEEAMSALYTASARSEKLRPIAPPQVSLKKFVPYTVLEFEATVICIGEITLADYKKVKVKAQEVKITDKEVEEVISNLQLRASTKEDVDRASKDGDQLWIDFEGFDQKGQPIERADGKDYPLRLGSNTFIPGFEPELVGVKVGDIREFTLTFPKDYGVATMQGKKVTFKVTVNKVQEVVLPKVDDAFAASLGPFKNAEQLRDDIKKQLHADKQQAADRDFEAQIVKQIVEKSTIAVPDQLIDEQVESLVGEVRQNAMSKGRTYEELLKDEDKTDEQYKAEVLRPEALDRIKAGLVLNEIAVTEKITVESAELDERIAALKKQYNDEKMRTELDKPENQRDIATRILTEKTLAFLRESAAK